MGAPPHIPQLEEQLPPETARQDEAEPLPERTHLTFGSSTKAALPGPSAPLSL